MENKIGLRVWWCILSAFFLIFFGIDLLGIFEGSISDIRTTRDVFFSDEPAWFVFVVGFKSSIWVASFSFLIFLLFTFYKSRNR